MSNGKNNGGGYERNETELKILQSHPLWLKVKLTQQRIREWVDYFGEEGVCVSFSGGKDSTVLLNLVRKEFSGVRAVFSNTGLEYPEVQRFAKSFDNVDFVYPKMRFDSVISTYGYPIISKEVAEAIYYARRIRTPERERERDGGGTAGRKRGELRGQRQKDNAWNGRSSRKEDSCKADETGRMEKAGNEGGEPPYPDVNSEKQADSSQRADVQSRDRQWKDWRRGCL